MPHVPVRRRVAIGILLIRQARVRGLPSATERHPRGGRSGPCRWISVAWLLRSRAVSEVVPPSWIVATLRSGRRIGVPHLRHELTTVCLLKAFLLPFIPVLNDLLYPSVYYIHFSLYNTYNCLIPWECMAFSTMIHPQTSISKFLKEILKYSGN